MGKPLVIALNVIALNVFGTQNALPKPLTVSFASNPFRMGFIDDFALQALGNSKGLFNRHPDFLPRFFHNTSF